MVPKIFPEFQWITNFPYIATQVLVFAYLSWKTAIKEKINDLVEWRIRFRLIFTRSIIIIKILVFGKLLLHHFGWSHFMVDHIELILFHLLIYYFIWHWQKYRTDLLFFEKKQIEEQAQVDPHIIKQIDQAMNHQKFFLQTDLNIQIFASHLGLQEYLLRIYINKHLDYRNFNDFLNQFRIKEACLYLHDTNKKHLNILNIAYAVGYNSIAPFNKAFKSITGMTPSEYRKQGITQT